jgi:AraC family transcriptional regulator
MKADSRPRSYGMFFGTSEVHKDIPGFSVSILTPTLRAEDVPLHTHENASFVLVLAGSYLSSADGAPEVSPVSTLIFNPAGTTHRDSFRLASGRFLAISISDESRRVAEVGTALPSVATVVVAGAAVTTAFRLARQSVIVEPEASSVMEGLCWELLWSATGERFWTRQKLLWWIPRARELLHDQCTTPLRITEMAQQLGVHPVYFARAFRHAFRCTPGEYLMRCRLRTVMALLRDTKLPLSAIALRAGFFDQSHLSRAFRIHFGLAPHAYQKRLQRDRDLTEVQFIQESAGRPV